MKIYISENERYKDVKSAGYAFTIMSIAGFIILILMWMNKLPINVDITNKIMMTIVMGVLFSLFLIIGIKSFLSLSEIKNNAQIQESNEAQIIAWFFSNQPYIMPENDENFESVSEENYFVKYNTISEILQNEFPDLKEEENDHITEIIISKLDKENQDAN